MRGRRDDGPYTLQVKAVNLSEAKELAIETMVRHCQPVTR